MRLRPEKSVELKLCALLIALSVLNCTSIRPFPTDTLIEYDNKFYVCGKYKITDPESFTFEFVEDVPCPSVFGFTSEDVPKVLDWAKDMQRYAKERCQ